MKQSDVIIIGGGIIGLATAHELSRLHPHLSLTLLEKEEKLAQHQTGHNSGVLHSGIYYRPGSLKAENCREGKRRIEQFCAEEGISHEICGKVIVAVDETELPALENIYQRGVENGILCEMIDTQRLHELEPHVNGIKAIHVPEAGIVDYRQVCARMAEKVESKEENQIFLSSKVVQMSMSGDRVVVSTARGEHEARFVVNCAGLHSDRVTSLTETPKAKIIPFRGEYFEVVPEAHHLCRNLIYPVPDPRFPFLGVHFTRMIGGGLECGPNAVLAFAREGYTRTNVNWKDLAETLSYPGFLKLSAKYWRTGLGEMWRSFSKGAFVRALQRLVPEIEEHHLEAVPAGIRAQAVTPEGKLVDDFLIQESSRVIHVGNAPSPAATSSLNIGRLIVEKLEAHF